jgi:hypothetical protein
MREATLTAALKTSVAGIGFEGIVLGKECKREKRVVERSVVESAGATSQGISVKP